MAGFRFVAIAGLCAVLASNAAGETRFGPRAAVLERLKQDDLRVGSLGFRLAMTNSGRCTKQMPGTGLILHSVDQYRGAWRVAAVRVFGAIGHVSVEGVVAQSPSATAGIAPGDQLISINGTPLDPPNKASNGSTARRDRAEDALVSLPPQDSIRLSFVRAGRVRQFVLNPVPACRARFEVVPGPSRIARADGRLIQLGQELVEGLSDEEVAFVLSHELAHLILDHRAQLAILERQGSRMEADKQRLILAREFEAQADRLAVHLLARAGFDPWAAPRFMRKYGTSFDKVSTRAGIHRPAGERADLMETEIAKLKSDQGG